MNQELIKRFLKEEVYILTESCTTEFIMKLDRYLGYNGSTKPNLTEKYQFWGNIESGICTSNENICGAEVIRMEDILDDHQPPKSLQHKYDILLTKKEELEKVRNRENIDSLKNIKELTDKYNEIKKQSPHNPPNKGQKCWLRPVKTEYLMTNGEWLNNSHTYVGWCDGKYIFTNESGGIWYEDYDDFTTENPHVQPTVFKHYLCTESQSYFNCDDEFTVDSFSVMVWNPSISNVVCFWKVGGYVEVDMIIGDDLMNLFKDDTNTNYIILDISSDETII